MRWRILVDTSVWIDLTRDPQQGPLLDVFEHLVNGHTIELIVPDIVAEEFARNKERACQEHLKSSTTALRRARTILRKLPGRASQSKALDLIADTDHQLVLLSDAAAGTIARVEALLGGSQRVETTHDLLARAATRALNGLAPFHRQRNEIADAIIIETYADLLEDRVKGLRFAFVTHNSRDFSHPAGDSRRPHPDLEHLFSRIRSLYMTNLAATLRRVAPADVTDAMFEHEMVFPEPRRISEIVAAVDEFTDKIWYDRHQSFMHRIADGKVKVVDDPPPGYDPVVVRSDIVTRARQAAKRVERRLGVDNLGPWTHFEWGMMNGKLSALRWVLGDEWDFLDT
jgi:predicted nucleic acid-binding protein